MSDKNNKKNTAASSSATDNTPSYILPQGTYPAEPSPQSQVSPAEQSLAGTSPPQATTLASNVPPVPPQTFRRVGTVTMAISLIAVGVLLLLKIFIPAIDYLQIARFSPAILVLLGLEILVVNFRNRTRKIKYDGLSMFVCLLLIGSSLFMATVPEIIYKEWESSRVSNRLSSELAAESYETLQKAGIEVYSIEYYVSLNRLDFSSNMTVQDIAPGDYVQVRLYFGKEYDNREAFAADVHSALAALKDAAPHFDYGSFYNSRESEEYAGAYFGQVQYALWLDNGYLFNESASQLATRVETNYWIPEYNSYVPESQYIDMLEHPEEYGIFLPTDEIEQEGQDRMEDTSEEMDISSEGPQSSSPTSQLAA